MVDLRHERAHRVHHEAAVLASRGHDLGRAAVRRQHERRAGRHVVDGVDEDHALGLEPLHDEPVVDDLVVAVDGRFEDPHHPHQRLDRHLDPGAEPPWLGQQHALHLVLGFETPRPPVEATEPEAHL